MDSKNRILRVMGEQEEEKKQELLTGLYHYLVFEDGSPLDDSECDALLRVLRARQESITVLTMLWRIALESKFHPPIEQYSWEIIEKSEKTYRCFVASCLGLRRSEYCFIQNYKRYAVSYLRRHNSAYFAQNFEKFLHERDLYTLYEVACEIGKTSVSQKITMLIKWYHKIPTHELYEIFTAEILAEGTVEHLELIHDMMKQSRKSHIYREIAAGLEAKLSSEL